MPRLNPNPITPELFAILYLTATVREVASYIIPIIPVVPMLPEVLLEEAKRRGTNIIIQYGTLVVAGAAESADLDLRAPVKLLGAGFESLASASTPEEAATRGVVALSSLVLAGASTADGGASFAFAGFLIVFLQKVAGLQCIVPAAISEQYLVCYILKQAVIFIRNEIFIEIERKKYGLPRKLPKLKLSALNPFRKQKPKDLKMRVLRFKKHSLKIRSLSIPLYSPYLKECVINGNVTKKQIPMVEFIPLK